MSPLDRLKKQLVAALERSLAKERPNVPEAGALVWQWFCDLSNARTYHMAGPNPISHSEIEAFARLKRLPLQPHHVDLIVALDRAWLGGVMKGGKGREVSRQPMTPAMFDAVFS